VNYFGKFDATVSDALGQHPGSHVFSETVHATHVPSDAIVVPDAQLLFGAEFKRTGVDLVLSGDNRELVLHDYFKGEHRAPLASPDGAHLTGDLVTALAGEVQYAQADGNASVHQVIGHVTKLTGTATAVRNGVSIILNNGDNVEKGDVVASGSDSTLGVTFIDGTVFGLSSNARMVLNEMVYDPNGSNNSSLLSLVAGTITFVAGETAKHGDMKIDTPVATMGIRGTAVLVEIDFNVPGDTPDAKFQVLVEPDGTTGSYILFDKTTLTPLAVVDHAGLQINISNGIMSQTLAPLSPEIQKLITDVFSLKFSDTSNTKSLEHFTDTITPTTFGPTKFAGLSGSLPTIPVIVNLVVVNTAGSGNNASGDGHVPVPPAFDSINDGNITELAGVTGSKVPDTAAFQFHYRDVNSGDQPTVSVKFASFSYTDAQGHPLTLNTLQQMDVAAVEAITNAVNQGTLLNNKGLATWTYQAADGAFDFLAANETLTLTYTATVDNNFAPNDQTGSQQFTITITGTNDAPVITSSQQNISFAAAGTDTKGGDLIPNTAQSGTLVFTDPDLTDTHTVAVKMTSALLDGQPLSATVGQTVINELAAAVTASIAKVNDSTGSGSGTIDWTLANLQVYLADLVPANESLVLTYAVTVTDSATPGATSVQDIVVTIGGNNNAAVVWVNVNPIPSGGALWSDASNWEGDRAPSVLGTDDVFIGTDQVLPGTPVFPATVNDAEAAKSLTMDYFNDFGTSIPELDVLSTGKLTIAGALNMDTSTDPNSPLTAESIIKNFGTLSVGGIATLLKHSVLDNYGTITLAKGGVFGDQSSITNSGTIEVVSDTLKVEVDIANSGGTLQVDAGATLGLSDGATISDGKLVFVDSSAAAFVGTGGATLKDVTVTGGGEIDVGSATVTGVTLTLDGATSVGGGKLVFGDASDNTFVGIGGATLDNVAVTGGGEIDVGSATVTGATLLLDDGTKVTNGKLVVDSGNTLDIEAGKTGPGATLDGVAVSGTSGDTPSTIEVGTLGAATLLLDDGTAITNGNLTIAGGSTLDIEAGTTGPGATLDGVAVSGTSGDTPSTIEVGTLGAATLLLDDGTTITNGNLTIDGGSAVDVESVNGATLDGVAVGGTSGGTPSTIAVGGSSVATLVLDGGTTVTNVNLNIAGGSTLDVEAGTTGPGATLDGVTVNGTDAELSVLASTIEVGKLSAATLLLDDGTTITNGNLTIAAGSTVDVESVNGATLDGVTVSGTNDPSTIEIGKASAATLLLDDGTTITNGNLTIASSSTLDVEAATSGPGATLDGVTVSGTSGDNPSFIEVGTLGAATLLLDDGTTITNGNLNIIGASTLDIEAGTTGPGATLDAVTVHGTNAIDLIAASTIEVGNSGPATLLLDDGTTITNGNLTIAGGSTLDVEGTVIGGPSATLDGVTVSGTSGDTPSTIEVGTLGAATLLLEDGTTITNGNLTIAGGSTLDSTGTSFISNATVTNSGTLESTSGTLTIDPIAGPSITNSGTLEANGGALDITSDPITNTGTLQAIDDSILTLTTLTVTNTGGTVSDALGSTIDLASSTISGGTVTINGELDSTGTSFISNATVTNSGTLESTSGTLTIDPSIAGPSITNSGTLEANGGALDITSDPITNTGTLQAIDDSILTLTTLTVTNTGGTVSDALGSTIDLASATISGGTLKISGMLDSTGTSFITNAGITNSGTLESTSGTLTIDPVAGPSIANSGTLEANGGALDITSDPITNTGTLQAIDDSVLMLTTLTVTNTGGTVSDALGSTIDLASSTISGGTLSLSGTLDSTGISFITGTTIINSDHIDVVSGTLTIDPAPFTNTGTFEVQGSVVLNGEVVTNSVTVGDTTTNGTIQIDHGGTLTLENTTINGGTIDDNGTLLLLGASKLENVTFNGTALIDVSGHTTLEIGGSVSSGVTVNFEVANGDSGLILDNPSDFHGVVEGLVEASSEGAENYIDLKGFADTTQTHVTSAVFNSSTDVTAVTITNGTNHLTIDLSGDYRSSDIEFATDHAGGTLFSDPAANSGAVTIDSGTTLDIAAASTATVSFANGNGNTGELVLADSKDFTGTIVGFTGDGTISNSDLVDLADVNIANVALNKTTYTDHGNDTGTLTLYNANGQALDSINLSGTYQLANFTIENDGDGGTLIVDPPVNTSGQSSANTHVASNQNPAADGFAFNFTGPHHAPTTDFHPDLDAYRLGGPMSTNLHTASNAAPDQGNFNMSLGSEGHDHFGLAGFGKVHLHSADFHFV
jgi:VCBS repeat-containing protein